VARERRKLRTPGDVERGRSSGVYLKRDTGAREPGVTTEYRFAEFAFSPERQVLTRGGATVRVSSRALGILYLLIERRESLVTKRDIFARVWPGLEVSEENIRINIAALRRALNDDQAEQRLIVTDHGRGYRFVATVTQRQQHESLGAPPAAGQGGSRLPVRLTSLVGRDEIIGLLVRCQTENRLLTIVGPGGIGKTTVAVAVARRVADSYADGAWLVDLAPLEDPHLMSVTLGSLLGVTRSTHDPLASLLEFLRPKRMLLVLDNCERLVEESARFAARILAAAPGVNIVATSREALGIETEHLYRLPPLATPPKGTETVSATETRSYAAVRLFIERALTRRMHFDPDEAELGSIADICRQLDGNPLAIELAAAAVETTGVAGIAAGLDRRFGLLTRGYRTSAVRHRSLRAVMDWSYDFLPQRTRTVLCRLSVFRGGFTLEAAEEIAHCPEIGNWEVVEHLTSLTDKSLVVSDPEHFVPEFRLLETVRAYTSEKLLALGELDSCMQRLAERCQRVFGQALDKSKIGISTGLRSTYFRQVDDLRASLDWAFASESRLGLAVALTIAAAPTLDSLGLFSEGYQILRTAIERLERAEPLDKHGLMQLYALVAPMSGWVSLTGEEMGAASRRLLELAVDTGRVDFQLSALRTLFLTALLSGQNTLARAYSIQMAEIGLTTGDRYARVVGQQRIGAMCSIMGEHEAALRTFAQMGMDTHPDAPVETVRYLYEPVCIQKSYVARTLWCMGQLDGALEEARGALERASRLAHLPTQFVTLIQAAALIPLWTGPQETAASAVQLCNEIAGEDRSLRKYARVFFACLQIKHGDVVAGTRALQEELLAPGFDINSLAPSQAVFYAALAEGFYRAQAFDEALALVERALEQARLSAGVWFNPELLRIKACALAAQGAPVQTVASSFDAALATARQQRGLYWELRAAFSHAQYLSSLQRPGDACAVLKPVYEKFTQGFDLEELRSARELLGQLT
jgi:predicted ATPase/DNA-binding winged helix-turn-helix (wHTH) protein